MKTKEEVTGAEERLIIMEIRRGTQKHWQLPFFSVSTSFEANPTLHRLSFTSHLSLGFDRLKIDADLLEL